MNVGFYAPDTDLTKPLRAAVQQLFPLPMIDLAPARADNWKQIICDLDLLIADITAQNAAASYLIGLADALGKRTMLLAPLPESVPQFVTDRPVIVHQWNLDFLRSELQKFAGGAVSADVPAVRDDTPSGKFHQMFGDLLKTHGYAHRGPVEFDGSTFTVREQEMELALVQAIAHRAKSLNVRVRLL